MNDSMQGQEIEEQVGSWLNETPLDDSLCKLSSSSTTIPISLSSHSLNQSDLNQSLSSEATVVSIPKERSPHLMLQEEYNKEDEHEQVCSREISLTQISRDNIRPGFLKGFYIVASVFWIGVFFLMCFEMLLFVVLEMMSIHVHGESMSPSFRCFQLCG